MVCLTRRAFPALYACCKYKCFLIFEETSFFAFAEFEEQSVKEYCFNHSSVFYMDVDRQEYIYRYIFL